MLNTLRNLCLQTRQSLIQCAYIITQVIAAPKLPYLHEWACRCGSEILRGQILLPGLSNYTHSSVPLRSLHHYFLTHGCLCCFIFYGYEITEENRRECFSLSFSLFFYSGDKAMFHSSTGESLRRYKFPYRIASSAHREHRHKKSALPSVAIRLTS